MTIYTTNKISQKGQVNKTDIKKVIRDTVIFFAAPALIYLMQIQSTLTQNQIVTLVDLNPSPATVGAVQGWLLSILINVFLKFTTGEKHAK